jgi:hypothetical protein
MGSWNYGIFDNDTALDAKDEFKKLLKEGNVYYAFTRLKEDAYYMKNNLSILAIADLQLDFLGDIQSDIRELVSNTIKEALNNINNWREPDKRKEAILSFKQKCIRVTGLPEGVYRSASHIHTTEDAYVDK